MNAKTSCLLTTTIILITTSPSPARAAIIYSGGNYSQNFDSLSASGTGNAWLNDSTISGWHLFNQNSAAITTYDAGTGSSATGSFYSFGSLASSERALGGVGAGTIYFGSPSSGTIAGWMAVALQNQSGGTLGSFTVSFNGEQWRNGGNNVAHTMVLEYGFGSSFSAVSTWIAPGGTFDWSSPVVSATAGAVDGNGAGLSTGRGGTINGLNWANNDILWIRWVERNDLGSDDGLAIDDFAFSATPVPEPRHYALLCALGLLAFSFVRTFVRRK